jgi:uncharacterized membrane protein
MVPTHWGLHGEVNGYSPRATLFLVGPGLLVFAMLLTAALPWLSPKRFEVDAFKRTFTQIMGTIFALFTYLYAVMLWAAMGHVIATDRAIVGGICLFVVLVANMLGKVRRNFYIGIRTPWALANERVWNATHRFGARTLMAAGVLGLVCCIAGWELAPVFLLVAGALAPVIYSLVYYKQLERRGELENGSSAS